MYAAIWRRLPGPAAVRALTCLVLLVAVVLLLFTVVLPAVEPHLPFNGVTVDPGPVGSSAAPG